MPVPDNLKEITRREWRDLGFYYAHDADPRPAWRLVGSRAGLAAFQALLNGYAMWPTNAVFGEHEHYGPDFYLKVMTAKEPGIDAKTIHGTLDDLRRLGQIVTAALGQAKPWPVELPGSCICRDGQNCSRR